jgi:hypothetical protein
MSLIKNSPNGAVPIFCQNYYLTFNVEKVAQNLVYRCNKKTAEKTIDKMYNVSEKSPNLATLSRTK